jgi:arginyl-tRNA synthetase
VVKRAETERAPHHVATYLIELAREFNAFYGNTMILDGSADEPYKLALVSLVESTLARGLTLLGIPTPERM